MSNHRRTNVLSRPAAIILALALIALTAPVLMLPRAQAGSAPLECTVLNNNGCTELSPIPPEDTASPPPNIVLMLDDSGSMAWDFMPDWNYLALDSSGNQISGWNSSNAGVRNSGVNGLYYNPATTYTPPPYADSTTAVPDLYPTPTAITSGYIEPFTSPGTTTDVTSYAGESADNQSNGGAKFPYYSSLATLPVTTYPPPAPNCPAGFHQDPDNPNQCISNYPNPVPPTVRYSCPQGGTQVPNSDPRMCIVVGEGGSSRTYPATVTYSCPAGTSGPTDGMCIPKPPETPPLQCLQGGSRSNGQCISTAHHDYFTYSVGTPGHYSWRYVASEDWPCDILYSASQVTQCTDASDTSGKAAPTGVAAGLNIAIWFSYYRTRILMAKSSLMSALIDLKPSYRFGFASINANGVSNIPSNPTPFTFDDSITGGGGGSSSNQLAVVQPFGDGSPGTQKALFWTWIAGESASNGTPLRKALQAVGEYYQTSQPWTTMQGDPGYTEGSSSSTPFACRASYTILTTDGFWNGSPPTLPAPAPANGYAAGQDGPVQTVPTGDTVTQYLAQAPFDGGGTSGEGPSLADVATYYWETDLQPNIPNEVARTTADPAAWQHMTTFTIGLGFTPVGITPNTVCQPLTDLDCASIFAWVQGGAAAAIPGWSDSSWPTPSGTANYGQGSVNNIADLVHTAVNGHGGYFSVKSPDDLSDAFAKITYDIGARTIPPTPASTNASVLSLGALSFSTGYDTKNWTGALEGVTLNTDGTVDQALWLDGSDANVTLTSQVDVYHSATASVTYANRTVYTDAYIPANANPFNAFQFTATNKASLDPTETAGVGGDPACATPTGDTLCNRIDYLLGDPTNEGTLYRTRVSIMGAIVRSQPVYVNGATGNYYDTWPTLGGIAPPENAAGAQTYDAFVTQQSTNEGMVYVGANDGMLHAFYSPVPTCTGTPDANGNCPSGDYSFAPYTNQGQEAWAFVPRAVYANLGNLTEKANFQYLPTVDATPVTRDVFFSEGTRSPDDAWHTILVGGVGLGGRGVYALDITHPTSFSTSSVLWEFDSDMTAASLAPAGGSCFASYGSCTPSDLGYTVPQPNIGRLANGKWVVLVPNGYFPDCSTPDTPTNDNDQTPNSKCAAIAAQAPGWSAGTPYSALFVLDAETGKMLAELKTPTNLGVTSFGLATPVLGDYNNDQVDDVAFAGDVEGNLWRFDLTSTSASGWTVTLVYRGVTNASGVGEQPITTMPRLFPDPTTNRFMVVFGTGRFLGIGDNTDATVQSVYGVRDNGTTWSQTQLTQQYLHEEVAPALLPDGTPNPLAGASLRCVTGAAGDTCGSVTPVNVVPADSGGWYINLDTTTSGGVRNDAGERVVVTPGAIFSSNTAVIGTLITGSLNTDPCNPSTVGAVLALDATTGGSAGVSSLGGGAIAGGRITNAPTSGTMPIASALGGGRAYLPGMTLAPNGTNVFSVDAPIWRRRSWQEINQNQ